MCMRMECGFIDDNAGLLRSRLYGDNTLAGSKGKVDNGVTIHVSSLADTRKNAKTITRWFGADGAGGDGGHGLL